MYPNKIDVSKVMRTLENPAEPFGLVFSQPINFNIKYIS